MHYINFWVHQNINKTFQGNVNKIHSNFGACVTCISIHFPVNIIVLLSTYIEYLPVLTADTIYMVNYYKC